MSSISASVRRFGLFSSFLQLIIIYGSSTKATFVRNYNVSATTAQRTELLSRNQTITTKSTSLSSIVENPSSWHPSSTEYFNVTATVITGEWDLEVPLSGSTTIFTSMTSGDCQILDSTGTGSSYQSCCNQIQETSSGDWAAMLISFPELFTYVETGLVGMSHRIELSTACPTVTYANYVEDHVTTDIYSMPRRIMSLTPPARTVMSCLGIYPPQTSIVTVNWKYPCVVEGGIVDLYYQLPATTKDMCAMTTHDFSPVVSNKASTSAGHTQQPFRGATLRR
ncbi:hypothetical protein EJ08DRAFT_23958 [Tothia fuscella]|uniref:Uncharacterized protein n=1 Tax=Tothia fuscella TaxID=1048955 RepID=A0A9P4NYP7_9PEZI|nr:hypothetical protein EJ08DRAFT_23958 [Tothia fuscella]